MNSCYVDTPVTVFKSSERCDTKRRRHCNPKYGVEAGGFMTVVMIEPETLPGAQCIDRTYWAIVDGKMGKVNDCQIAALSDIFANAFLGLLSTGPLQNQAQVASGSGTAAVNATALPESVLKAVMFYTYNIVTNYDSTTSSDGCDDFLSAVGTIGGQIIAAVAKGQKVTEILQIASASLAKIATRTNCCNKRFVAAVLGNPEDFVIPKTSPFNCMFRMMTPAPTSN